MSDLGQRIIKGLEEALEFMDGRPTDTRSTVVAINEAAIDVRSIRDGLGYTQKEFAETFGFSVHTLRNWEQGQRQPEKPTKLLLLLIRDEPAMVGEYVAKLRGVS